MLPNVPTSLEYGKQCRWSANCSASRRWYLQLSEWRTCGPREAQQEAEEVVKGSLTNVDADGAVGGGGYHTPTVFIELFSPVIQQEESLGRSWNHMTC